MVFFDGLVFSLRTVTWLRTGLLDSPLLQSTLQLVSHLSDDQQQKRCVASHTEENGRVNE